MKIWTNFKICSLKTTRNRYGFVTSSEFKHKLVTKFENTRLDITNITIKKKNMLL